MLLSSHVSSLWIPQINPCASHIPLTTISSGIRHGDSAWYSVQCIGGQTKAWECCWLCPMSAEYTTVELDGRSRLPESDISIRVRKCHDSCGKSLRQGGKQQVIALWQPAIRSNVERLDTHLQWSNLCLSRGRSSCRQSVFRCFSTLSYPLDCPRSIQFPNTLSCRSRISCI
jgi:hypothetical protein